MNLSEQTRITIRKVELKQQWAQHNDLSPAELAIVELSTALKHSSNATEQRHGALQSIDIEATAKLAADKAILQNKLDQANERIAVLESRVESLGQSLADLSQAIPELPPRPHRPRGRKLIPSPASTVERYLTAIEGASGIPRNEIIGGSRLKHHALARHALCYALREFGGFSFRASGTSAGLTHHASVLEAVRSFSRKLKAGDPFAEKLVNAIVLAASE